MSMNLYVEATRKAWVKVKGKKKPIADRTTFDFWQTPTKLTYEILSLPNDQMRAEAYIRWADEVSRPYEENVYDYDGVLNEDFEYPVIGTRVVKDSDRHIAEFREWLQMCDNEDYNLHFYTI